MRNIARLSTIDRSDIFADTALKMGVNEGIIEKDFWVCWALDVLFTDNEWKEQLNFKGGTSLSKAYGLIDRFSEDIDLILDWRLLGYGLEEPWAQRSNSAQDRFIQEANIRLAQFIADVFVPKATTLFKEVLGTEVELVADGNNVIFKYPHAFDTAYIRPEVVLEMGTMAAWVPWEMREIHSFAAGIRPELFSKPWTLVRTVKSERTFWEKATILHQEAHRSSKKPMPSRYSRHYYDLYKMANSPIRSSALNQLGLLKDVVKFKSRFYRCPWAKYEDALCGELKLLPPDYHLAALRKDYGAMRTIIFGNAPELDVMLKNLQDLEYIVNELIRNNNEASL
ncbi:MAG TPA: nucleotidyl transferase AbiEii/AbiGii toxin family protein [Rectinema sp.]|jgi:hypothetical protein|nr:nucleotidyl transferase AbiEii/AbiGii toxin family protein [Rectinema sp.]HNZ93857.1 nucleotidyl transferase AbiEii/AbiGii toxin family protein [Rectinema sp.]HOH16901.1 nucleotidyl transferase AbiEii/AbiGii toxin family protein [Rectinema sp.]HPW47057.1 nucleotidyl transferase AbiEii/AbiGii toxin family protein [Rectinema sp.]HQG15493.1 nucleotidyl transferase AbiEii/AbiGii toxin family protein [Rectinema sp.]